VQAALLLSIRFPPPAAFAFMLPRMDGARAWLAADRHVTLFVQRIVGNALLSNMGSGLGRRPVGKWIEF